MYDFLLCFWSGYHLLCLPDIILAVEDSGRSIIRRLDMAMVFHGLCIAFLFLSGVFVLLKVLSFIINVDE